MDQAKKDAWDYLNEQRGLIGDRQIRGMDPYSYLQTVKGHIDGGQVGMAYADLTTPELRALCDQELEFQRSSVAAGDDKGAASAAATIQLCLEVLHARGEEWHASDPVKPDDPFNPPSPPHDPSRGRNPT